MLGGNNIGWRFRLFGFPVRIDVSFWIMAVILGLRRDDPKTLAIWVSVVFVSIMAHELGHALMGRAFGMESQIELFSMGGLTRWTSYRSLRHWQDIAISLAGPLTGLTIGGIVYGLVQLKGEPASFYQRVIVYDLVWVNLGWGVLNLLPIEPLDGGHTLASVIHWMRRDTDPALPLLISVVVGGGAILAALMFGMWWGGLLAGWLTFGNVAKLRRCGPIRGRDQAIAGIVGLGVAVGLGYLATVVRAM
jgi:stage IV sporulation protein FB